MNIIDERDKRTKNRKKAKQAFDKAINLSVLNEKKTYNLSAKFEDTGKVRLLDEGAIVTADGDLDIYIMRGTIEKYLNGENTELKDRWGDTLNLTPDHVGSINIGHLPFAEFPVGIVGEWTKEDLSVVDTGDDRKGLDVDVKLNPEHPLVEALKAQGIPVGVSVEMYLHFDEDASSEENAPMVDEIFISDFAIVGECGNVGSSDSIVLQGVNMDEEKTAEIEEVKEAPETGEETPEKEAPEEGDEKVEDSEETATEDENEEADTEEAESESESEESVCEEDPSDEVIEALESMKKQIESLNEQIDALKKTNRKLNKKLKAKNEADEKFMEKFKGLSISLGEQKEEEKKEVTFKQYAAGNGKGVL